MRAACAARDAAERAWRDSKDPAPAAVRLGRAQTKLDRAVALQADARRSILDEERAHKERMGTLQSALEECNERVRLRRAQLREVQREVGAGGVNAGGSPQARAQRQAMHQVHRTICGEIGPTIEALVEQLDSSAPAWGALNGLLGKLSASKTALEEAGAGQRTDHYDIGGGDHVDDEDEGVWDAQSDWSESHDLRERQQERGQTGRRDVGEDDHGDHDDQWAGHQQGPWGGADDGGGDDFDGDQDMGTGDWWCTNPRRWGDGARWQPSGHSKWRRASWADQSECDQGGPGGEEDGPPPPARRRLEGAAKEQGEGPAQGGGAAAAGGAQRDDPEAQKRLYEQRLDQIISMAISAGVNPVTSDGDDLRLLGPHQLDEWVSAHLPSALLC